MMKIKTLYTLTFFALFISACNIPISMMSVGNSASFVYPVDGAQFQVGDVVDIKTQVDFSSGASSAILVVNDTAYRTDNFSQPIPVGYILQPWMPSEAGTYILRVHLSGADGEVDSNSVTVIVGEAAPVSAPTLSVGPTALTPTVLTSTVTSSPDSTAIPTKTEIYVPAATSTSIPTIVVPTATIQSNGAISGKVYRDENGNGNFNPADTPLAGVTVLLGAGVCPSSGFQSTQTGGDGTYAFSGLPAGQYCVAIDAGSLPAIGGTWQSSLANPKGVNLGAGENIGGRNFMFQPIIQ